MVEDKSVQLTEDETELYDRQIRLWGIDSQKRLRNARVLIIGLDGLGAEIVKNLVLSGVKSVLMLDDKLSTEQDSSSQFLIPVEKIGQNRAEASVQRAQNLNPLVSVKADTEPVITKSDSFFHDFEVVVSCSQNLDLNLRLDAICRSKGISFISAGVYGTYGYIFYDYKEHSYTKEFTTGKKDAETKTKFLTATYPPMESVFNIDLSDPDVIKSFQRLPPAFFLLKVSMCPPSQFGQCIGVSQSYQYGAQTLKENMSHPSEHVKLLVDWSLAQKLMELEEINLMSLRKFSLFYLIHVLYKFRSEFRRDPSDSEDDLAALLKLRDVIMDGIAYPKENFPDSIFRCITVGQLSPCCAIVGAVVSQEVIKVVSKKDEPHHNFFFFNPLNLSGFVQSIVPP